MKLIILSLSVISLYAQTVSITSIDGISTNSARVLATASANAAYSSVKYAVTNTCATTQRTEQKTNLTPTVTIGKTLHNLKPATTYYVCFVAKIGGVEYTSSSSSFTTLALPTELYARPTEAQVNAIPAVPTVFGTTLTLDATNDCNNTRTGTTGGLQALWDYAETIGGTGHIVINWPLDAICKGTYTLPTLTGSGTLLNRNSSTLTYPPEGVVVDRTKWDTTHWPKIYGAVGGALITKANNANIRFEGIEITNDIPTSTYKSLVGTCVASSTCTTSTAHGWVVGDVIQIKSDENNFITSAKIATVPTSTTFTFTSYYRITGAVSNGAMVFKDPTFWTALVNFQEAHNVNYIIFDRVYFHLRRMPINVTYGILFYGNDLYFINSSIEDITGWGPVDPDTLAPISSTVTSVAIGFGGGNRKTIRNNIIKSPGITLFTEGGSSATLSNALISRNYFEWPLKYLNSNAAWDGTYIVARQNNELKQGNYVSYIGNRVYNQFQYGQTGNFACVWVFTPRPGDSNVTSSTNEVSNVIVESNTAENVPGGVCLSGSDIDAWAPDSKPSKNFWIVNNVFKNTDGRNLSITGGYVAGSHIYVSRIEGLTVRHNLFGPTLGTFASHWYHVYDRNSRVFWADNIIFISYSAPVIIDTTTITMSPAMDVSGDYRSDFLHSSDIVATGTETDTTTYLGKNVFIPTVDVGSTTSYDFTGTGLTKAACTAWGFTGSICAGAGTGGETAQQRINTVKFKDFANRDYKLLPSSPYIASGNVTTDGKDAGPDFVKLYQDQGYVANFRATASTNTTATIGYYVYNAADACTIEYGTSATYGTGTRVADGLTGTVNRTKQITGLTGGTTYYFRVLCPTYQSVVTKSTL